jgi:hypothetical protein
MLDAAQNVLAYVLAAALLTAGVSLLYRSWKTRRRSGPNLTIAGWAVIAAGVVAFSMIDGGEVGTTYALLALSLAGYAIIAATMEFRTSRARNARDVVAEEPEQRPANWPRAVFKAFLAIVFAGIAAIGVGVAFAVAMPLQIHDRIVIGGLLVPILWGGGMAWTLADAKLLRATIFLLLVSAIGYGIAFLPKVVGA